MKKLRFSVQKREIVTALINKMLEKHGVTMDDLILKGEVIDGENWYNHYTWSKEEEEAWIKWSKDFLKNNVSPKLSKKQVNEEIAMFHLNFGLKMMKPNS